MSRAGAMSTTVRHIVRRGERRGPPRPWLPPPETFELKPSRVMALHRRVRDASAISERDAAEDAARITEAVRSWIWSELQGAEAVRQWKDQLRAAIRQAQEMLGHNLVARKWAADYLDVGPEQVKALHISLWQLSRLAALRTRGRGRPLEAAKINLFCVLRDVYERRYERLFTVWTDQRTRKPRGKAFAWTLQLLQATPLSGWARRYQGGVADLMRRVTPHQRNTHGENTPKKSKYSPPRRCKSCA